MTRPLLGAAVLAMLAVAGPAVAADMAVAPIYKAPPVVAPPAFTWTGFYVGAHAGYDFARSNADVDLIPVNNTFRPIPLHADPKGFIGGVQAGYNWQQGAFVLGGEADLSFANIKFDDSAVPVNPVTGLPVANANQPSISEAHENIKLFGTARARLGITPADRVLVYATGGLAYAQIDYSASTRFFIPNGNVYQGSDRVFKAGWTAGAGAEWAVAANWSLKAEYLYYDLGDHTLVTTSVQTLLSQITDKFRERGHIVRAGFNIRFAPDVVVARY